MDHQTVESFCRQPRNEWPAGGKLRTEATAPSDPTSLDTQAGQQGMRPLGIPTVRDRVVQTALLHVLEPIFESRSRRTAMDFDTAGDVIMPWNGSRIVERRILDTWWTRTSRATSTRSRKRRLMERVREKVSDSRMLRLVEKYLEQGSWTDCESGPRKRALRKARSCRRCWPTST